MTAPEIIGYIESVDDQQIVVQLSKPAELGDSEETCAHIGQVGSYVVIPQKDCDMLATVIAQRKTSGPEQDRTVINVLAVGMIREGKFCRGIHRYPVVSEPVRSAEEEDLAAIFAEMGGQETDEQNKRPPRLALGKFTANPKYEVSLDGKAFCARHAAILGSSGSGKSCTVAQIVQQATALPGVQVVLFDLHGEYFSAFADEKGQALDNVAHISANELVLPYWLLKYEELEKLFVDYSNLANVPTQKMFLKEALMRLRGEAAESLGISSVYSVDSPVYFSLEQMRCYANNLNQARCVLNSDRYAFKQTALRHLPLEEQDKLMIESDVKFNLGNPEGEIPHPVYYGRLCGLINLLEQKLRDHRYDFLLRPIQQAARSTIFKNLFQEGDGPGALSRRLEDLLALLTGHGVPPKNLSIIRLSRIPFETVDITVALLTRVLYEFNFWCTAEDRIPFLLVYEEAHNYIAADQPDGFARRAVERVAKEGRKYGVGALVVSQRPMELSETVLSQCNSFILMRMSNPADQAYVAKVVSEQFSGLAGTLAQLRPGEVYAVGEAVPMPMRTKVYLTENPPDSEDANFFAERTSQSKDKDISGIVEAWWRQERPDKVLWKPSSENQAQDAHAELVGTEG